MLALYGVLILGVSAFAFFLLVINPKRRRLALTAFVAPIGFGVLSILGLRASSSLVEIILGAFTSLSGSPGQIVITSLSLVAYLAFGLFGAWIAVQLISELEFRFPAQRRVFLRIAIAVVVFELIAVDLLLLTSKVFFHFHSSFSGVAWYGIIALSLGVATGGSLFAYKFFQRPVDSWISVDTSKTLVD
ncbi:MAG TPA: hypothetical protein VIX42_00295 [Edaphobacter sp.]